VPVKEDGTLALYTDRNGKDRRDEKKSNV